MHSSGQATPRYERCHAAQATSSPNATSDARTRATFAPDYSGSHETSRARVRRSTVRLRGRRRADAAAPAVAARAGPDPPGLAQGAARARAARADAAARRGDVDRGVPRVQRGP